VCLTTLGTVASFTPLNSRAHGSAREAPHCRVSAAASEMLHELRALAAAATDPEESIAINSAIIAQDPRDVVALNRLGRANEALGAKDLARQTFRQVLRLDPKNAIAAGRIRYLDA
jgi:cytochrome c-type biogenesis protein CcmH/NrfG